MPHDPFMQTPRPPAIIQIAINGHEWRPHNGWIERRFVAHIDLAIRAWLKSATVEFDSTVPTSLLIDVTFGTSTYSLKDVCDEPIRA